MPYTTPEQLTLSVFLAQDDDLLTQINAFLVAKRAERLRETSLLFYSNCLAVFSGYCQSQAIKQVTQITANDLREYLLWLEQAGHNPGGIHAYYRALRAFLRWWECETEPDEWRNPLRKVKAPKVAMEPLEPAGLGAVKAMLQLCKEKTFLDTRDKAALLFLMDTGVRASDFVQLDLADCEYPSGAVTVRRGKGGKSRTVFMGRKTLRAVRVYLRLRDDKCSALWVTDGGTRITYFGLRSMVVRRAKKVGVKPPSLHSFRRFFALQCLRNGMDIFTLQKAMGHADLTVLRLYLAQTTDDVERAHRIAGPVDNAR